MGSVTALTDSSSAVVGTYDYDAYGNTLNVTGSIPNPFRFSTKEFSPTSGLVYFGARFYNPQIGRWLNQDPLGMINGPNMYAYVGNNPINLIDPWGCNLQRETIERNAEKRHQAEQAYQERIRRERSSADANTSSPGWSYHSGPIRLGGPNSENCLNKPTDPDEPWWLMFLGARGIHPDYNNALEKTLHFPYKGQWFRFNKLGQLVEHTGKVIGNPTVKAAKALKYLKNIKPKFFTPSIPIILYTPQMQGPIFGPDPAGNAT